MSSLVGGDLSKIETGPCKVTYKTVACGHTQGGVSFAAKPSTRERKVDEYGENVVEIIHQGDTVTAKATFAEKSMQVLQTVYQFGYQKTSAQWGWGRRPGKKGTALGGPLLLHPLDGSGTSDDVNFYIAVVSDNADINFGTIQNDRLFEADFTMLADPTKADGYMFGYIGTSHG